MRLRFDWGLLVWGGISSGCGEEKNGFLVCKQDLGDLGWWSWGG